MEKERKKKAFFSFSPSWVLWSRIGAKSRRSFARGLLQVSELVLGWMVRPSVTDDDRLDCSQVG